MTYEGILIGFSVDRLLSYKVYLPKLNHLLITADKTFQEYDDDEKSYDVSPKECF